MKKKYILIILNMLLILTSCNHVENENKLQDFEIRMDFDKNEYSQDDEISVLVSLQYTGSDTFKTIYLEEDSFDTMFIHENGKKLKINKPFTSMIGRKNITRETPIIFDYTMFSDYDRLFITGLFKRYDSEISSLRINPEKKLKLYPGKYTVVTTLKGYYDEARTDEFYIESIKEIEIIRNTDYNLIHFTTVDNNIEALIYTDKVEYYSNESKSGFIQIKNIGDEVFISDTENIFRAFFIDSSGNKNELFDADSIGKEELKLEPGEYYGVPLPLPYRYESGLYQYQILLNKDEEIKFDFTILDDPVNTKQE